MNRYQELINNARYFLNPNLHTISNLANLSAYLFYALDRLNWVGFYLMNNEELYLGPFQGKPACTTIDIGKGVCGTSAKQRKTIIVDDVHQFDGHIACDQDSKSEIVVPIITKNNELYGVLDIDSPVESRFDEALKTALEKIVALLVDIL